MESALATHRAVETKRSGNLCKHLYCQLPDAALSFSTLRVPVFISTRIHLTLFTDVFLASAFCLGDNAVLIHTLFSSISCTMAGFYSPSEITTSSKNVCFVPFYGNTFPGPTASFLLQNLISKFFVFSCVKYFDYLRTVDEYQGLDLKQVYSWHYPINLILFLLFHLFK